MAAVAFDVESKVRVIIIIGFEFVPSRFDSLILEKQAERMH